MHSTSIETMKIVSALPALNEKKKAIVQGTAES
jgi:hypothetical protein